MNIYQPVISGSLTVTGSTTFFGNITVNSGSLTMTSGSLSGTASLASNALLLQGTGSVGFTTTASLLEVSSSQQQISASLLNVIATGATTGSNSFRADQSITGSLVVSSTITAQTLVVQTVTSSIVYSSGSNNFGSALTDRQTFTGSLNVTGSGPHTIFGNVVIGNTTSINASAKLEVKGEAFITPIGTTASKLHLYNNDSTNETYIYDSGSSTNSILILSPGGINKALVVSSSGNVGIGTTNPTDLLHLYKSGTVYQMIQTVSGGAGTVYRRSNSPTPDWTIGHGAASANENFEVYTAGTGSFTWTMNGAERMRIGTIGDADIRIGGNYSNHASANRGTLNINGTSTAMISLSTGATTNKGYIYHNGNYMEVFNVANSYLAFGTNNTETMRISSAGIVTKPYHPVFHVAKSDGNVSAGNTVIWNFVYTNVGSYYNSSNGRFTAPVAGVYYFAFSVMSDGDVGIDMALQKNGVTYQGCVPLQSAIGSSYNQLTGVCTITLAASDYVTIYNSAGTIYTSNSNGGRHTMFCGFLVG